MQNATMFDWGDLRHFLAVAETGSTLAAGRALRVSQTTVARRIAALEEALGLSLFDRRRAGYALTPAGEALLVEARAVADAAAAFGESAAGRRRASGGTVRVTAEPSVTLDLLPAMLLELRESHPEILIEVDASEELRDLEGGAADVAVRVLAKGDQPALVGRRLGPDFWSVYCSRSYAETHGIPPSPAALAGHPMISVGGGGQVGRYYSMWLRENGLEAAVAMQHGSVTGLLAAVRSGLGIAALPCLIAELDDRLVRCFPGGAYAGREIWLLCHERLRHEPAVRAVMQFLGERLGRHTAQVRESIKTKPPLARSSRGTARQAAAGA